MGNNNINGGDLSVNVKNIIADGKVEAKELKGLTEAEKEALEKYLKGEGKELPKEGEITYLKDAKILDMSDKKEQKAFFGWPVIAALGALLTWIMSSCTPSDDEPQTIIKGDTTYEFNGNRYGHNVGKDRRF